MAIDKAQLIHARCPYCTRRLRTEKSQQCLVCGADWHGKLISADYMGTKFLSDEECIGCFLSDEDCVACGRAAAFGSKLCSQCLARPCFYCGHTPSDAPVKLALTRKRRMSNCWLIEKATIFVPRCTRCRRAHRTSVAAVLVGLGVFPTVWIFLGEVGLRGNILLALTILVTVGSWCLLYASVRAFLGRIPARVFFTYTSAFPPAATLIKDGYKTWTD